MSDDLLPDTGNGEQTPIGDPDKLLTVREMAALVGINERNLRNYLELPEIRQHMEPVTPPHPKTPGKFLAPLYPVRVTPKFQRIAEMSAAGTLTPKRLQAAIKNGMDLATLSGEGGTDADLVHSPASFPAAGKGERQGGSALIASSISANRVLSELSPEGRAALAAVVGSAVDAVAVRFGERAFPAPEDKLLNLKEAHEETGLPLSVIRARIPAVTSVSRNRRWKRSVLRQFIADL